MACLGCGAPGVALCLDCAPSERARERFWIAGIPLTAAGAYEGVLRRAIVDCKRGERAYLDPFARLIAALAAPDARGPAPALVPLPTSRRRRAARGFDQAVELARRAGEASGLPVAEVLVKHGAAQRGRDRRARLAAGGRFAVRPRAALPARAIVVDDVCTTGATLSDAIAALRAAEVDVVGGFVLARTAPGRRRNPVGSAAVVRTGEPHERSRP